MVGHIALPKILTGQIQNYFALTAMLTNTSLVYTVPRSQNLKQLQFLALPQEIITSLLCITFHGRKFIINTSFQSLI